MISPESVEIRAAKAVDCAGIERIYLDAFPRQEGATVARLALELLRYERAVQVHSYVAVSDDEVVGHVAFSPVSIAGHKEIRGYILAPLGVRPGCQKQSVGSRLVQQGIEDRQRSGVDLLFVYGDPAYYGRFGFRQDLAEPYKVPYPLEYPTGWQLLMLNDFEHNSESVGISPIDVLCDSGLW